MENTPEMSHTSRDTLTLPVFLSTPDGLTKMPDPMMLPTMTVMPFTKVIFGLRVISSSLAGFESSSMMAHGVRGATQSTTDPRWKCDEESCCGSCDQVVPPSSTADSARRWATLVEDARRCRYVERRGGREWGWELMSGDGKVRIFRLMQYCI